MEWLLSLAFLPLLLCGLMCAVPMALAGLGVRRRASQRACCDDHESQVRDAEPAESVRR